MEKLVTTTSKLLMKVLLEDSKISTIVLDNETDAEKYKICTILDNGTIVLGKTSVSWWNQLINCQDKIPFDSFALKIWSALSDMSEGKNKEAIINGLSLEIVKNSVRKKDYNYVIQRLYDCWRFVAQKSDGYKEVEHFEGCREKDSGYNFNTNSNEPKVINIKINGVEKKIPFIDSEGKSMNINLEYGFKGFFKS